MSVSVKIVLTIGEKEIELTPDEFKLLAEKIKQLEGQITPPVLLSSQWVPCYSDKHGRLTYSIRDVANTNTQEGG